MLPAVSRGWLPKSSKITIESCTRLNRSSTDLSGYWITWPGNGNGFDSSFDFEDDLNSE